MIKTKPDCLIVFVRNPVMGKVKTRLAKTVGDERAMEIYLSLLSHTIVVGSGVNCDRVVFFSETIENDPVWKNEGYFTALQEGADLGERMFNAFRHIFGRGYERIVIIGSDCPELTPSIITEAFAKLGQNDVVIGPATDGGYYLLGLSEFYGQLFTSKQWSGENVLLDTINDVTSSNLSFYLLETLSDVDEEKDLTLMERII